MFKLRFVRTIGMLAVLLAATVVGAQPSPRFIPVNDSFSDAIPLPLGKSVKIGDPTAATEEGGEPNTCGSAPYNSIWYVFTPDRYGNLFLSTAGTKLIDPLQGSDDTVLSVYSGTSIGTLNPITCSNNASGGLQSELNFSFSAGQTYYIQLTTYRLDIQYAAGSFYKLTTRVIWLLLSPTNQGFEEPLTPDNWQVKNGTGDDVACMNALYPAFDGDCTFKFTGSAGEKSKLAQTVDIPAGFKLRKNAIINVSLVYRPMDALFVENAKLAATLIYSDGTPSHKITLNFSGQDASGGYYGANGIASLASGALSKVKIQVKHKSTAGTLLVDEIYLYYSSGTITREAGAVLPAPAAKGE